ncbi:hypothetical protein FHW16_004051 [Phyllobacterium myrsinacearum]|uniref:Lytic murein transglycosylase n=1 Tax=Phyllobacterium myrsinacearum TaxID=28101 RepID=A0A839EJY8_9HYPH|nr:hypothetical protein [Phyllobacterium myrsinacearum]
MKLMIAVVSPPLCPVGHLPHKGGDHIDINISFNFQLLKIS